MKVRVSAAANNRFDKPSGGGGGPQIALLIAGMWKVLKLLSAPGELYARRNSYCLLSKWVGERGVCSVYRTPATMCSRLTSCRGSWMDDSFVQSSHAANLAPNTESPSGCFFAVPHWKMCLHVVSLTSHSDTLLVYEQCDRHR